MCLSTLGFALACGDDAVSAGTGGAETVGGETLGADAGGGMEDADAGLDGASGDGDGDASSGDGDGDAATGDGDGDAATGDGDGAPDTGDGDGDSGTGDGDGDPLPLGTCGNGIPEGAEECDDGNLVSGDGCSSTCVLEVAPKLYFCGNKLYACGDGIDNDMDGKIDLADPECTTPCDDDEGSFQTDLPGQNLDCKTDCYFDANSGAGDDDCQWSLVCDPVDHDELGCAYNPNSPMCPLLPDFEVSDTCSNSCTTPLVPNGCDCFGCCEIEGQFIYLGGAPCTLADALGNPDACTSCTQVASCTNSCDTCEVCFGQTAADLPDECPEPVCPMAVSCLDSDDCPANHFCQTGCCVPNI